VIPVSVIEKKVFDVSFHDGNVLIKPRGYILELPTFQFYREGVMVGDGHAGCSREEGF
jgi:hypothetical protein